MVPSDQHHSTSSAGSILLDIEPSRDPGQNCFDGVVAGIARWLGRNHELMYINAWRFTFTPEIPGQNEDLCTRLQVDDQVDKEALERFHGLKSTTHEAVSSSAALPIIQRTLETGSPVALVINSFWVPWDDKYQQQERTHACIVVGSNPHTQDLYCTDPYFMQKDVLLPSADFLKGYLFCETFSIVDDECTSLLSIIDAIIECLQREIAGNRPFIQMRDLANALSTSFQVSQGTGLAADTLEVSLFMKLTNVANARFKSSQMFTYLGSAYNTCFLVYAERLKKLSSQWRIVGASLMKMHLTSRWSESSLQKVVQQILTISTEEQALAHELLAFLESFRYSTEEKEAFIASQVLPAPQTARSTLETQYIAPRDATEEVLVKIWSRVLDHEDIGVEDDFFALGGHSLLATQVIARIRAIFGLELTLLHFFKEPTIASQALSINQSKKPEASHIDAEHIALSVDQLSDEDVDVLLHNLLTDEEAMQ